MDKKQELIQAIESFKKSEMMINDYFELLGIFQSVMGKDGLKWADIEYVVDVFVNGSKNSHKNIDSLLKVQLQ